MNNKTLVIIDFGSCYVPRILLALKTFEPKLSIEVIKWNEFEDKINNYDLFGVILSGSPSHLYEPDSPNISNKILNLRVPVLGICYGMQIIAQLIGASVVKMIKGEFCDYKVSLIEQSDLFIGLGKIINTAMRHNDQVINIPLHYKITAQSDTCVAAIECVDKNTFTYIYGVQFHPELKCKGSGATIFKNFLKICNNVSVVNSNKSNCLLL